MSDAVNHPNHYTNGDVECIDAIKSALGPELFCGYLWGNSLKYLWRWMHKNLDEDLEKCKWYINRLQAEGYSTPAKFDTDSGCMIPNAALEVARCGDSVNVSAGTVGDHANNA